MRRKFGRIEEIVDPNMTDRKSQVILGEEVVEVQVKVKFLLVKCATGPQVFYMGL